MTPESRPVRRRSLLAAALASPLALLPWSTARAVPMVEQERLVPLRPPILPPGAVLRVRRLRLGRHPRRILEPAADGRRLWLGVWNTGFEPVGLIGEVASPAFPTPLLRVQRRTDRHRVEVRNWTLGGGSRPINFRQTAVEVKLWDGEDVLQVHPGGWMSVGDASFLMDGPLFARSARGSTLEVHEILAPR